MNNYPYEKCCQTMNIDRIYKSSKRSMFLRFCESFNLFLPLVQMMLQLNIFLLDQFIFVNGLLDILSYCFRNSTINSLFYTIKQCFDNLSLRRNYDFQQIQIMVQAPSKITLQITIQRGIFLIFLIIFSIYNQYFQRTAENALAINLTYSTLFFAYQLYDIHYIDLEDSPTIKQVFFQKLDHHSLTRFGILADLLLKLVKAIAWYLQCPKTTQEMLARFQMKVNN
ncbi:hypothetical protein pb186bvf_020525 [Paramecium bursaria]